MTVHRLGSFTTAAQRLEPSQRTVTHQIRLATYPLIAYAESLPIIRRYWLTVFGLRPTATPSLVVADLRGALAAVKSSAGISVLPSCPAAEELVRGEVVKLLEPELPPTNTFYLATRDGDLTRTDLSLLHGQLLVKARLWM
ncbi:LysR substrate-binding domain-containing protein [Streptomyces sp. NPDC096310]|uniref:LysR substrate-binding domain-containing protein n=1 Tax=Streptomyces sp. NPDC096310 TaxID=3366082 RepID=UPI00381301CA